MRNMKEATIIVPLHNEEENLPLLFRRLDKLSKLIKVKEFIFINDHSTDNTKRIIEKCRRKNIKLINRTSGNKGMGYALIDGTSRARTEYIIWLMGDNSDDINTIPRMIEKLEAGLDMVMGSRYMKEGSSGDLEHSKAFLSKSYSKVFTAIFRIKADDITNAFRAFKKKVFYNAKPHFGDFRISPEFAILASRKGFKIGQVPTTYSSRKKGKCKFRLFYHGIKYAGLIKYIFMKRKND